MTLPPDPLDALLHPRSIAIVGASPTSYVGRVLCENLDTLGYDGQVFAVNPRYEDVLGHPCYSSVDDLPEAPEAVVSAVSIEQVPAVLQAAAQRGARAAVIPGGGFTETGERALAAHQAIAEIGQAWKMSVAGPNCMGVIVPPERCAMYIGTVPRSLLPGHVALLSQSGSVVEAAVNMGPRIGFSALVSFGDEAVTTAGAYLGYLARDAGTRAVALFVEGFHDAAAFIEGARALREAGKPLAVLHAGRSGESTPAVAAHSGALAARGAVVSGLLRQLGAIGVADLDELFEVAELLGHGRLPRGRRLFVVTDSGGEGNLVADHARHAGLELPPPSPRLTDRLQRRWPHFSYVGNPIDPWGVDRDYEDLYREVLAGSIQEDVDVVAVGMDKVTPWAGENETHLGVVAARALITASEGRDRVVPLMFTIHSTGPAAESVREPLRAAEIPLLHGLRPAMLALRHAWWWQQWPARSFPGSPPARHGPQAAPAMIESGPVMSERASREYLSGSGIPFVPGEVVESGDDAVEAAHRLGFPVVMKADVPGLAHKDAAGLVFTSLASTDKVRTAFAEMTARARSAGLDLRAVHVQRTARGVELICGAKRDPVFGPVVLLGLGGSFAELLGEASIRLCPPSPEDVKEMLEECAAGRLLSAGKIDPAPVLAVVEAVGRLALDPRVEELDLNPLFAGRDGTFAADVLLVLAERPRKGDGNDRGLPSHPGRI